MHTDTGIEKAIVMAGGLAPLAEALGVSYQAVQRWRNMGCVPLNRRSDVLALYPGIPVQELMSEYERDLLAASK